MAKKIVLFILMLVLLCLVSFSNVAAESFNKNGASLTFPEGFTVLNEENLSKNSETVKMLGHSVSSLKTQMEKSGIIAIAVDSDNSEQFIYKCVVSSFSERTESFDSFNDEALKKINTEMFGGNARVEKINGTTYFYTKSYTENSDFYTYQYVTVQSGKLYSFIYYGNTKERITDLMSTVKIEKAGQGTSFTQIGTIVLMSLVMIGIIVVLVLIAISVIRDLSDKKNEENDVAEYIRIKRRKY